MTNFKKNDYKFWHSPYALFLLFLVLVFFGYNIIDLIKKERETANKKGIILDQINELKERENMFSNNILKLDSEEGKEAIIREKYQVAKAGEKMVIIVNEEEKNISSPEIPKTDHSFLGWIKNIFNK